MKSAVVEAVSAEWKIKEIPQPKPTPNQVLIKIVASGLCYTDVHLTEGHIPVHFPHTLGHEPVGEIVEKWQCRHHKVDWRRCAMATKCLRQMRMV